MKARPVLLHDDARDDVLKGLLQLGQAGQTRLDNTIGPLVHFGVLRNYSICYNGILIIQYYR